MKRCALGAAQICPYSVRYSISAGKGTGVTSLHLPFIADFKAPADYLMRSKLGESGNKSDGLGEELIIGEICIDNPFLLYISGVVLEQKFRGKYREMRRLNGICQVVLHYKGNIEKCHDSIPD
jgi:hypothetical protein